MLTRSTTTKPEIKEAQSYVREHSSKHEVMTYNVLLLLFVNLHVAVTCVVPGCASSHLVYTINFCFHTGKKFSLLAAESGFDLKYRLLSRCDGDPSPLEKAFLQADRPAVVDFLGNLAADLA